MNRNPNCTLCLRHQTAKSVCYPGLGAPNTRILVIRDSVSEAEDVSKVPLSDRAGKLLTWVVNEAGLKEEVSYTYATRCWSPDKPKASEVKACHPFLVAELPGYKFVVPLGKIACQACGFKEGLDDLVGKPQVREGVTYLPTYSPENILARPALADAWVSHWKGLRSLVLGDPVSGGPDIRYGEIVDLNASCEVYGPISLDIETTGLDPRSGSILSIGASNGKVTWAKQVSSPEDIAWFINNLDQSVVHNVRMERKWKDAYAGS